VRTAALAERLAPLFAVIAERRLASSLLLFVAGHRPCAFLAGQAIYMTEPLCDLMGVPGSRTLAELLCRPDGFDAIAARLLISDAVEPDATEPDAAMPETFALQNRTRKQVLGKHVLE
jgi:hypothetical protein